MKRPFVTLEPVSYTHLIFAMDQNSLFSVLAHTGVLPQSLQDGRSDPGHIVQLVHRLEGPVFLPVSYDVLGPLLPDAGQALKIILVRREMCIRDRLYFAQDG